MPRHSPDALTLRLRIRTTNGNAVSHADRFISANNINDADHRIACALQRSTPRHRFKPIHNVKEEPDAPYHRSKAANFCLHLWKTVRARTPIKGMVEPIGIEPMT
jgi:hypothetical protein